MSHSGNSKDQQWTDLLSMYFSVKLSASEAIAWFIELRHGVKGWRHDAMADGSSDPTKGESAKRINNELCDCLRYIANLDTIPRKTEGGKSGGYAGKPNVKDISLWIYIFRKSTSKAIEFGVHHLYTEAGKKLIQRCIDKGQPVIAAIVADGNPSAADSEDFNEIFKGMGSRSFSDQERTELLRFCDGISFSPRAEFEKFYEQDTGRKPVSRYASELSEQYDEEEIFG